MAVMIGGHSALGNIRVNRILYTYPNGVYLAQISAFDSETNQYIAKTNNNGETLMFPQAYMNQIDDLDPIRKAEGMWVGISNSGVRVEGYTYPVVTAFPSAEQE